MEMLTLDVTGPHAGQPAFVAGEPLASARTVFLLLHGRGASAEDILTLGEQWAAPGITRVAPQAAGATWYPRPFTAPTEQNEPALSSAFATVDACLQQVVAAGVPPDRVILLGFSQGASLALTYAALHPRRYGGVVGLSGGLIGPDDAPPSYSGSLAGTPAFLGCSDVDPFIPADRVRQSADALRQLGAVVTLRLYRAMAHTVNDDEIAAVRSIADQLGV